eukprot:GHVS01023931.1.p1 GENE.GHVS01023931.1~~GHVS01023931.1.p1  ORF type:complete len:274 (+),score=42.66 GHVS01023931.1:148-969(+)
MIVKGRPHPVLLDTAALGCNLVGSMIADQLKLQLTGKKVPIRGIGTGEGRLSQPFAVKANGHEAMIAALVLPDSDVPLLLGIDAIRTLQLKLDSLIEAPHQPESSTMEKKGTRDEPATVEEVGDEEEVATLSPQQQLAYTHNTPQQSQQKNAGTYLSVAFPAEAEEDASTILEGVEAMMDSSLTSAQKAEVIQVLKEFQHTWFKTPEGGGACIAGLAQLEVFGRLLEQGLVVPSKSPWAAAPHLWDLVQQNAGKRYVAVVDLKSGFWNIPLLG